MRNRTPLAVGLLATALVGGCARSSLDRARPDEFAVARQAPLVIPPDYALVPPQPGAPTRGGDVATQQQTLDALFGGLAPRSASERAVIGSAGADGAEAGIRSAVGDPQTSVVDKGSTTRDIVAAPEGDGQDARAGAK